MKRINPETGSPFRKGDKRPSTDIQDDKVFESYRKSRLLKSGLYAEIWFTKEQFNKRENFKKSYQASYDIDLSHLKKRINPKTGKAFKNGDKSGNLYFHRYVKQNRFYILEKETIKKRKYFKERWCELDEYIEITLKHRLSQKKMDCRKLQIPFDLDYEYLRSIFPKDNKCPITKKKFVWTSYDDLSPEIDRKEPKKGYTKGNVIWMSRKTNILVSFLLFLKLKLVPLSKS